jgi:threonyl-tRNA synthetase
MDVSLQDIDHRRLGRDLKMFHLQEDAAGSVFWHPRGNQLFRTIESYIRSKLERDGYQEVKTPQLIDKALWEKSGHWEKFQHNMYVLEDESRQFAIKPMNCPGHVQIFNSDTVSYRQMPLRLAEFGCCHRSEPSGALHGIMRVRQFTQDDAHIFCRPSQVVSEVERFINLLKEVYLDFGFSDVVVGLSTRPDIRAGSDADWDKAEHDLAAAVDAAGLPYEVQPGEGAFYGPKLEFALKDLKGRQWQCGTIQLDMVLPERLDAKYVEEDGSLHRPVMLHRAILGSLERFIGILLEHYEGNLPFWLSPENVVVIPLQGGEKAAEAFRDLARSQGARVIYDDSDENLKQKIKVHSEMKRNWIVVIGKRDVEKGVVSLRRLGNAGQEEIMAGLALMEIQNLVK